MFTIWVNLTSFEFLRNIFQKRIQLPISEDIRPMSRPRSQWKAPDSGNLLSPDSGDLFPFYTNCLPVLFHPKYLDFLKYFIFNLDLNIWNVLYVSSQSRAQSMLLPAAIQSSKLKGSFVASCIHCAFHLERNQDWRSERYMQALKCFFFRKSLNGHLDFFFIRERNVLQQSLKCSWNVFDQREFCSFLEIFLRCSSRHSSALWQHGFLSWDRYKVHPGHIGRGW